MKADFVWEGRCDCGDPLHRVLIERWDWKDDDREAYLEVSVATGKGTLRQRIKNAVNALRGKTVYYETVVLTPEVGKELQEALGEVWA